MLALILLASCKTSVVTSNETIRASNGMVFTVICIDNIEYLFRVDSYLTAKINPSDFRPTAC
jgi:hypothetical protein